MKNKVDEREIFKIMFEEQDSLNKKLDKEWWNREDFNFPRAVIVELVELLNCYNWEWWKEKENDIQNARIELIDIWHFLMSWILKEEYYGKKLSLDNVIDKVKASYDKVKKDKKKYPIELSYVYDAIEDMIYHTVNYDLRRATITFFEILDFLALDLFRFFAIYMGKKLLNKFRWEIEEKYGKYVKLWGNGIEDNMFMLTRVETFIEEENFCDLNDFLDRIEKDLSEFFNWYYKNTVLRKV